MSDAFDDLMERQASPADMVSIAAVIAPISLKSKFCSFKHVKRPPSRRVQHAPDKLGVLAAL